MREKIHELNRSVIDKVKNGFLAIDLETTGSDPHKDDIIEVGVVFFHNLIPIEKYSFLCHTDKPIPEKVTKMTGLTSAHLKNLWGQDNIFHAIQYVFPEWREMILCAHRADFDVGFLEAKAESNTNNLSPFCYIDTMEQAQKARVDVLNYKLDSVAAYYNIDTGRRHRALDDAETSGLILVELIKRADKILKFNEELEEMLR